MFHSRKVRHKHVLAMTLYTPFVAPENFDKDSDNASLKITKREYFAGLAMQGILASGIPWKQRMEAKDVACECLCLADALIKQLEQ
jgi:hypothetical protein